MSIEGISVDTAPMPRAMILALDTRATDTRSTPVMWPRVPALLFVLGFWVPMRRLARRGMLPYDAYLPGVALPLLQRGSGMPLCAWVYP